MLCIQESEFRDLLQLQFFYLEPCRYGYGPLTCIRRALSSYLLPQKVANPGLCCGTSAFFCRLSRTTYCFSSVAVAARAVSLLASRKRLQACRTRTCAESPRASPLLTAARRVRDRSKEKIRR